MFFYKKLISCILYFISLALTISVGIYVVWVSKEFILASEGIGVYGVLIYYAAVFVSVVLWGLSYWLVQNKKLAIIFWVIFLIFTVFIAFQPTWWAAPVISS